MDWILLLEQGLNAVQFGLMLFLLAAGLTLVFGIMDTINLAHGSFYMIGAYLAASIAAASGSFVLAVVGAMLGTAMLGVVVELSVLRRLYQRDHLSQVMATFALILILNEATRLVWGPQARLLSPPASLAGAVELVDGLSYSAYRLLIIAVGLAVALFLYWLIGHTRAGMWVRAGASDRPMALAMGVDVPRLFTAVFAGGCALGALAGALLGPLLAVEVGMGERILILAFVVIVIGGIGSVRGALVGALLVGVVDTFGRSLLPLALRALMPPMLASNLGPALASVAIYVLMAAVLFWRPRGLFPARA
jgi:branched-chain amino acid transport system permease protein